MNNPTGAVAVPLSTFGGLSTELTPADIPEGGSPSNQDVAFYPGSVTTRPGFSYLTQVDGLIPLDSTSLWPATAAESFSDTTERVYETTLRRLDGTIYNVYLHASGNILVEDFTNQPGLLVNAMQVAPGSLCKSVTVGGKLYMTFHDGLHGTDIPRWFDGDKWGRISQDGPCVNPTFSEVIGSPVDLGASTAGSGITISTLDSTDQIQSEYQYWDSMAGETPGPNGSIIYIGGWVIDTQTIYSSITVVTATAHGLSVGNAVTSTGGSYQLNNAVVTAVVNTTTFKVSYSSPDAVSSTGGTIGTVSATLSRNNGTAIAHTATAHGLKSGDMFSVSQVGNTAIGGGISAVSVLDNIITITTTTKHGCHAGDSIKTSGIANTLLNGTWDVTSVVSDTIFTLTGSNLADGTSSGGNVYDVWTKDKRFVVSTPDAYTVTYVDNGPDDSTTNTGKLIPVGQVAGGSRNAVCLFQTNTGYITQPSIPVQISTSGDKKLVVTGVPIGPSNVVARILAFTGVNGSSYFYIPVPARKDGNVISTSTVINDNTSTTAILDFPDTALLSASGIDIDGNNLFRLRQLGNCASVNWYAGRMQWIGDENNAIRFRNMGFEGGTIGTLSAGWTVDGTGAEVVENGDFGDGIKFTCSGSPELIAEIYNTDTSSVVASATITPSSTARFQTVKFDADTTKVIPSTLQLRIRNDNTILSQSAYLDYYGNPILEGSTRYSFKAWTKVIGDGVFVADELRIIYSEKPWNDTFAWISYVDNYESVDGVTGVLGSASDASPIMETGVLRDDLYFVTLNQHPRGGNLHKTTQQAGLEPSQWTVSEVARNVGSDSMASMVSGESWLCWANTNGAVMFDGTMPKKITQDIQELWESVNRNAFYRVNAVNDIENRRIYWDVPFGANTSPSGLIVLDYRYGEDAGDIEDRASVRVSQYTGKMLVTDLSRKFSKWTFPATFVAYQMTTAGMVPVFAAGNKSYRLDASKLHDDDYGAIPAFYVTSFFCNEEQEEVYKVGSFRHLFTYMTMGVQGVGKVRITPLVETISGAWEARGPYLLSANPTHELELPLNVSGRRSAFKVDALPLDGSQDAFFDLSRMVVTMKPHPFSPVRGA